MPTTVSQHPVGRIIATTAWQIRKGRHMGLWRHLNVGERGIG